jgi:two-component system, cell cycle response regulator DivK
VTSSSPGAPGGSPSAVPLVLVVDDSELNRKLARDVLRAAGFRTVEAANGREAIALARDHGPDVILLDLRLPDMEGVEVARALLDEPGTARIPVIALSAVRHLGDDAVLRAAGFDGYIAKPIDIRTFPAQVRRSCGARDA